MSKSSFEIINEVFKFLVSIAVILGVILAYETLGNRKEIEEKRLAINAVSRFSDKWFMDSYLRVLEGFDEELMPGLYDPKEIRQLYNDLSIVLNVINSVAILYENELADRCIIKRYARNMMEEFSPVLDNALAPYSKESSERIREHFDNFEKRLKDNVCD